METVLLEGYKVEYRDNVPCSFDRLAAVRAYTKYHPEHRDLVVLDVWNVPDDLDLVDYDRGCLKTKHLEPEHLRAGVQ